MNEFIEPGKVFWGIKFVVPGLPEEVPYFRTGSSVIGGATPESDIDIVILYDRELDQVLRQAGYEASYDVNLDHLKYPNTSVEVCYRFGKYNIIAVKDQEAYIKWLKFTNLARTMGLTTKNQRVVLAQFVTEGLVRGTHIEY